MTEPINYSFLHRVNSRSDDMRSLRVKQKRASCSENAAPMKRMRIPSKNDPVSILPIFSSAADSWLDDLCGYVDDSSWNAAGAEGTTAYIKDILDSALEEAGHRFKNTSMLSSISSKAPIEKTTSKTNLKIATEDITRLSTSTYDSHVKQSDFQPYQQPPFSISTTTINLPVGLQPRPAPSTYHVRKHDASISPEAESTIEEPLLLTLTSFPYRIIHANDAFKRMTSRNDLVGSTFFDLFQQEGPRRPTIANCPTIMGRLDGNIVKVIRRTSLNGTNLSIQGSEDPIFCKIGVKPVYQRTSPSASCIDDSHSSEKHIRNFMVSLNLLDVSHLQHSSVVYLSMPQGALSSP